MKRHLHIKLLSVLLMLAMMLSIFTVSVSAEEKNGGKYLKDVFIAYGTDKTAAEKWLRNNGWEPVADLNEGKTSNAPGFKNAVAVLGIRRTSDPNEAITDMAVLNMKGEYSFDDYESIVAQKKTDINEFIKTFIPAMEEYRENYNGKGSAGGKKRAQLAHDLLNRFFDGDPNGEYAMNDTGKPLGDLFLSKTKTEIGDDAYNALSAEQRLNVVDFQQIILESSGPAVLIIEQSLALAADTAETSWLDRLDGLTGEALVERIAEFAPEVKGQDLAPSAARSLLAARFYDYTKNLAAEWINIHEDILWFEQYCDEHELWQDKTSGKINAKAFEQYFKALKKEDKTRYEKESKKFNDIFLYYYKLKDISYSGEWGETLYDFFRPEDEQADYSEEYDFFAPLAASLSKGQRAALEFIKLSTLLKLGVSSDSVMEADLPSIDEFFSNSKNKQAESISIYTGINRSFFRMGVALTMDALIQKGMGYYPYEDFQIEDFIIEMIYNADMGLIIIQMILDSIFGSMMPDDDKIAKQLISDVSEKKDILQESISQTEEISLKQTIEDANQDLIGYAKKGNKFESLITASRWLDGIGGGLMVLAAALSGVQICRFYHRTFTMIPVMVVDKADRVSYTTDANGNQVNLINFDQFVCYEAVKCNRQEIGLHKNVQNGVSDYIEWGCGSVADINADVGKQWLAMYVNRSSIKGDPILADSLTLQKVNSNMPAKCSGCLHMFTFESPVKIDDTAYCYRDDNKGMYLFWKGDETAFAKSTATGMNTSVNNASMASAFNAGYLALAGIGGLTLGIFGTTLVLLPKLKKKKEKTAE